MVSVLERCPYNKMSPYYRSVNIKDVRIREMRVLGTVLIREVTVLEVTVLERCSYYRGVRIREVFVL